MTVTINLSSEAEARLREQAAAAGRDAEQYASEIIERAVNSTNRPELPTDAEQARLRKAARELIRQSEDMAPTLKGPVITDFKKAIAEIIDEKAKKQGLQR